MEKPIIEVDLQGPDGNVFALTAKARAAILSDVRRLGSPAKKIPLSTREWDFFVT